MLSPDELESRLKAFHRLPYGAYPTPLEPLERLSREIGAVSLWIKRDDGLGPAMGGNKGRKLEYLMAEALQQSKNKVVTLGGLQSNHARMTAAAAATLGMQAHVFFFEPRPAVLEGNLLLNRLLGAQMHFIPFGGGGQATMTIETTNRLVRLFATLRLGPGIYFIPVGGHNVTGCLGYVNAALEIHRQWLASSPARGPATLVIPCGTGGTLAGLLAGFRLLESPIRLLGIDVGKLWKAFPASLARLAAGLCAALGRPLSFRPEDIPLIEGIYAGPGYARPSPAANQAIRTMAQTQGILLDPIYTGKAFAGLLDLIRKRYFQPGEQVIFLHTGGAPGLWADPESLAAPGWG